MRLSQEWQVQALRGALLSPVPGSIVVRPKGSTVLQWTRFIVDAPRDGKRIKSRVHVHETQHTYDINRLKSNANSVPLREDLYELLQSFARKE
jgi:hypothetical protein